MPPIRPRTIALLIAGLIALISGVKLSLVMLGGPNLVTNVNTDVAKLVAPNKVSIVKPLSDYTYVFTIDNTAGKLIILSTPSPYAVSVVENVMMYAICDNGTRVGPKPLTDYTVVGPFRHCEVFVRTPVPVTVIVRVT